ncbi:MAG: hypothetical protein A3F11_06650 [Gammaproteobacteria bacterium RIFCSPHIGHO2_12_FULL_37_14]|nr:MAG: hypothetical protein A3F11_06650 [Gammaproteobacteria bacterium RIFCSPHIGHO2_12_FULL_37_14]
MLSHAYTSSEKAKICALELRDKTAEKKFDELSKELDDLLKKQTVLAQQKELDDLLEKQTVLAQQNANQIYHDAIEQIKHTCATHKKDLQSLSNQIKIARAAQAQQKKMAEELFIAYQYGSEDTPVDAWEAKKYKKLSCKLAKELKHESILNETEEKNLGFFKENLRTNTIYVGTPWYTAIRLFIIYINRILGNLEKYDMDKMHKFLPKWFSILGLSYGVTFLLDCVIVLYSTFRKPISVEEAKLSKWTRFKNVLMKGTRPNRMANDGIWFAANLIGIILTGGLSIAISFAGFIFDEVHEIFKPSFRYKQHRDVVDKIQTEINESQIKLDAIDKDDRLKNLNFRDSEPNLAIKAAEEINTKEQKENDRAILNEKIAVLHHIKTHQKHQALSILKSGIRPIVGTTLILIGMFFILYPPSTLPAIASIGIGLSVIGGTVFTGLFYKIGDYLYSKIKSKPKDLSYLDIDTILAKHNNDSPAQSTSTEQMLVKMETTDPSPKPMHEPTVTLSPAKNDANITRPSSHGIFSQPSIPLEESAKISSSKFNLCSII